MLTIQELSKIELDISELVVSVIRYRDYLIVITDRGTMYKLTFDEYIK